MEVKLFEVRDRATFIAVMAIRLSAPVKRMDGMSEERGNERWLLRRAGYAMEQILEVEGMDPYVIMTTLEGGRPANYDPYNWGSRTLNVAHLSIIRNWETLRSGDVLDVEFILGEVLTKKESERLTVG